MGAYLLKNSQQLALCYDVYERHQKDYSESEFPGYKGTQRSWHLMPFPFPIFGLDWITLYKYVQSLFTLNWSPGDD